MLAKNLTDIPLWTLVALAVVIVAAFLWLRQSSYWAGVTPFSESHLVENFRAMDRVFPARPVPRCDTIRTFERARAPFPKTYVFNAETRDLARFLDRTETTGLLVVRHGVITQEEYLQGADEASHFTSWTIAKSVPSALRGIAVE